MLVKLTCDEAAPLLGKALSGKAGSDSGVGLADVMRGAELFGVVEGDKVLMAFALRKVAGDGGATCWVTALGAAENRAFIDAYLPQVEKIAADAGCGQMAMITARRGLVKKMAGYGFKQTSVIMRKGLADGCR